MSSDLLHIGLQRPDGSPTTLAEQGRAPMLVQLLRYYG